MQFNWRAKRVRDNIADPVYQYVVDPLSATNTAGNGQTPICCWGATAGSIPFFCKCSTPASTALIWGSSSLIETNQLRGGQIHKGKRIIDWSWVLKAKYLYRRGRLTLAPMAKSLLRRTHRAGGPAAVGADPRIVSPSCASITPWASAPICAPGSRDSPVGPIVSATRRPPWVILDARHYILALQNRSNYSGFTLSVNLGFRASRTRFVNSPGRQVQRFKEFFVQARVL